MTYDSDFTVEFNKAKCEYIREPSEETYIVLKNSFKLLTDNSAWVRFPIIRKEKGMMPARIDNNGRPYFVLFTAEEEIKLENGVDLAVTDMRKLIDTLYGNPAIAGIAVDPFGDEPLFLRLGDIENMTEIPNPRKIKRDWGKGIPKYVPSDVMVPEEILEFAFSIIEDYLERKGHTILEGTLDPIFPTNFVTEKDGRLCFVVVRGDVLPKMPVLSEREKKAALEFGKKNNGRVFFASVGFGSTDEKRFEKGLALIGDGFYANFEGLKEIK